MHKLFESELLVAQNLADRLISLLQMGEPRDLHSKTSHKIFKSHRT